MVSHRHTFSVIRRMRKHQYYHQKWKPIVKYNRFNANNNVNYNNWNDCGYGILWELDSVDRKIQTLQSEIYVLKQQLKIIQTNCVPTEKSKSSNQSSRYFHLFFF